MKKLCKGKLLSVICAAAFALTGCIDLTPVDYSEINPAIFPKTEADVQALVLSCYYPLRGSWWDGMNSTSERGVMYCNDSSTGILTSTWGIPYMSTNLTYNYSSGDITRFFYTREAPNGFANKISRCTVVLDQIERSTLSKELKERYGAEVRCCRAMISYILFDMFGPLVIAPIEVLNAPLNEASLPRSTHDQTVKFIEDDLLYAAKYLPLPARTEYGKFSRGLAKMMLIRLYLHETTRYQGKVMTRNEALYKPFYEKVETLARELMGSEYGYGLVDDYARMFEVGGQGVANKELIWAIPCSYEGPNQNQWHMMVLPTDFKQGGMGGGWGCLTSSWWFYDSFEQNDKRKSYMLTEYTAPDGKGGLKVVDRNTEQSPLALGPIPMKYGYDPGILTSGGYTNIDIVMYRYADVLLSLAEALYFNGGDKTEALGYINDIRDRAGLDDLAMSNISTEEKFVDVLLLERAHELWCESGQNRADLIRFDRMIKRLHTVVGSEFMNLEEGRTRYLFPLPLDVIIDGKGAVKQNPGYE